MDSLGDRMKAHEEAWDSCLPPRTPVILRVDGKAFHTYCADLSRPWHESLLRLMDDTAKYLVSNIQGAQLAYVQSDEISILVHSYKTFETSLPFNSRIQKLCSVTAAFASSFFSANSPTLRPGTGQYADKIRLAQFDCRAFALPESEVCNYFVWRQQDATRNSVQMLAHSLYAHKELDGKAIPELLAMCQLKGEGWEKLPRRLRFGRCIVRGTKEVYGHEGEVLAVRNVWRVDDEIPIFSEAREYINSHLAVQEA